MDVDIRDGHRGVVLYHPSGLLSVQVLAGAAAPWVPYLGRWDVGDT